MSLLDDLRALAQGESVSLETRRKILRDLRDHLTQTALPVEGRLRLLELVAQLEREEKPQRWIQLEEEFTLYQQLCLQAGEERWRTHGPTPSARYNQLFHLCEQPLSSRQPSLLLEHSQQLRAALVRAGDLSPCLSLLDELEEAILAQTIDLEPPLEALTQELQRRLSDPDFTSLDQPLRPGPWWVAFLELVEQYHLGLAEEEHLLHERTSFQAQLESTLGDLPPEQPVALVMAEFHRHLDGLDACFEQPEGWEEWEVRLEALGQKMLQAREKLDTAR